jgi:hypothetical protein
MPAVHNSLLERITIDPDVRFGKPCIRGHRITILAGYVSARRASRIDPLAALRHEQDMVWRATLEHFAGPRVGPDAADAQQWSLG